MKNKKGQLMKNILSLFFLIATYTTLLYAKTTTSIDLTKAPYTEEIIENEYGDKIMYQDIIINTQDFKVQNFWKRFYKDPKNESVHSNIATTAKIKLTIQNSFTCKDGHLASEGCSGQKPFLINQYILNNPDLQLSADNTPLPDGEYRIPFDSATNYNSSNQDAFYALDVYRDDIYYKETSSSTDDTTQTNKNFFGYIIAFFTDYFSKDTTIYGNSINSPETRDRYMANIIFGLQQSYRIAKDDPITTTETNGANSNKKVTLLDYNSQIIESTEGCNNLFFSFDPDSLTCKTVNFFGISRWMPFIGSTDTNPEQKVYSDSVLEDTETTLLTLAGKLDNVNYIDQLTEIDSQTGERSFIQEIFKPMSYMMSSMFRFFFGENSKNLTEMVSVHFDFIHPMPLTFIQTDGSKAIDFIYFELLGLESVYGTEVESCKVKQTAPFVGFTLQTDTFTKGIPTNTKFDMEFGFFSSLFSSSDDYSELNVTVERHTVPFVDWGNHDIVNLSTDDWLDWCKRNQGRQSRGLFGRFIDTFTSFILSDERNDTYDEQIDNLLQDDNWEVVEYKEKVHKGLILHLKKITLDNITSTTAGTTTEFEIVHVKKGALQ